jgi:hypothetical protein
MQEETVVASFQVLYCHLPGRTVETMKDLRMMMWPRFSLLNMFKALLPDPTLFAVSEQVSNKRYRS